MNYNKEGKRKKLKNKNLHFIIFTGLLPVCQLIFVNGHKNAQVGSGTVIDPGSVSVIQDYGFKDPDPKEIFTDPQHCGFVDLFCQ